MTAHEFHGMKLFEDDRVQPNEYVLTDDRGIIIAGGNLKEGTQWRAKRRGPRGEATRIRANAVVVKQLLLEKQLGIKPEVPDGHRIAV